MRGSHHGPLTPVKLNSTISYFDGPPVVTCAAFCIRDGKLTEAVDAFDHPYWDWVRHQVSQKAHEIRRQGFFGPAMLPFSELEYGGIVQKLKKIDKKFKIISKRIILPKPPINDSLTQTILPQRLNNSLWAPTNPLTLLNLKKLLNQNSK